MIGVDRGSTPEVLTAKAAEWTAEYLGALEAGGSVSDAVRHRYRHPQIKEALRRSSSDKCVYCESKVQHTTPGTIDHIFPVSERPELIVDWENLAYACPECNRRKGPYYDPETPLLNPYGEDPSSHIAFFGPCVFPRPADDRALMSVERLGLSRAGLIERRKERIEALQVMIDRWQRLPAGSVKDLLKSAIREELLDDKEFAAAARAFVAQQSPEVLE